MTAYQKPATLVVNGKRTILRSREGWAEALHGHRTKAHGGALELETCAACRELHARVNEGDRR